MVKSILNRFVGIVDEEGLKPIFGIELLKAKAQQDAQPRKSNPYA